MSPLAWLAIPLVAVLVAMVAVTWASRPRRRAQARRSAREYESFKAAFSSRVDVESDGGAR